MNKLLNIVRIAIAAGVMIGGFVVAARPASADTISPGPRGAAAVRSTNDTISPGPRGS